MKPFNFLTISLISLILTGCANVMTSRMPQGSVPMAQSYNNAINGTDGDFTYDNANDVLRKKVQPLTSVPINYTAYTRTAANEINNQFPRLPNPNIVMYVYPHLTGTNTNQVPVPGYSTVFPLYTQVYYAVPGENKTMF